jgi:hypothetical protein
MIPNCDVMVMVVLVTPQAVVLGVILTPRTVMVMVISLLKQRLHFEISFSSLCAVCRTLPLYT